MEYDGIKEICPSLLVLSRPILLILLVFSSWVCLTYLGALSPDLALGQLDHIGPSTWTEPALGQQVVRLSLQPTPCSVADVQSRILHAKTGWGECGERSIAAFLSPCPWDQFSLPTFSPSLSSLPYGPGSNWLETTHRSSWQWCRGPLILVNRRPHCEGGLFF